MIYVIISIISIIFLYLVFVYNNLIKNKNLIEEGWSGIDVQLKRRSNLIPNILNSVKGYMSHEKNLLEEITELRSQSNATNTVIDQGKAESALSGSLMNLFVCEIVFMNLFVSEVLFTNLFVYEVLFVNLFVHAVLFTNWFVCELVCL